MFKKVLVANRGEIACRILGTCRRLGIGTVAVFSDADQSSPHVTQADEAERLGAAPLAESYLNVDALLLAAKKSGAEAVHPGYGLLSENAGFAQRVSDAGLSFIGPSPAALAAFGDKVEARRIARAAGLAPPPGSEGPIDPGDEAALESEARRVGFPVLVKARGGGGGIGMQIVHEPQALAAAARACSARAGAAFGTAEIYLERYLAEARHIEVQLVCDRSGRAWVLGDRECSVQRRHQKIIEEAPSPASFLWANDEARRRKLWADASRVLESVGYRGAGTVELVADASGDLYFLEVNARLQVEHPVTELTTGLDLVELQLRVAAGEPLSETELQAAPRGYAVEARVYAEDPDRGFLPQPGVIRKLILPSGEGVRVDSGVVEGNAVTPFYDPLLFKVSAFGETREQALDRLKAALSELELVIEGPKGPRRHNVSLLERILSDLAFRSGAYDTHIVEKVLARAATP